WSATRNSAISQSFCSKVISPSGVLNWLLICDAATAVRGVKAFCKISRSFPRHGPDNPCEASTGQKAKTAERIMVTTLRIFLGERSRVLSPDRARGLIVEESVELEKAFRLGAVRALP